jgi:hypothetical protein
MEVVVILGVALALSCVAVTLTACWVLVRYVKQLSSAAELVIRCTENPSAYLMKARADAIASGRQQSLLVAGQVAQPAATPESSILDRAARTQTEELDNIG